MLTPQYLPPEIRHQSVDLNPEKPATEEVGGNVEIHLPAAGITLEEVEKVLIQQALERYNGNQTKAANCLGMSRDTIRYRMKKFEL